MKTYTGPWRGTISTTQSCTRHVKNHNTSDASRQQHNSCLSFNGGAQKWAAHYRHLLQVCDKSYISYLNLTYFPLNPFIIGGVEYITSTYFDRVYEIHLCKSKI